MLYKQRVTFYDVWDNSKSRALDHFLYTYFSTISGITGVCNSDGSYLPSGAFDYLKPTSISSFRAERQQFAIFSKNVSYGSDEIKQDASWNSFCETELNCKRINDHYRVNESLGSSEGFESIIHMARRKIAQILGDVPSISDLDLRFGPGANSTVKNKTSSLFKLEAKPTCSKSLVPLLPELWATMPHYASFHKGKALLCHGELAFVPKDSLKHRSIIIEPLLNTLLQKGIGAHLKKVFKTFDIDLTDQSINRNRARISSLTGKLATVDMSNASDNIAYSVVLDLLPKPWFDLLDAARTSYIVYKKKRLNFSLQKFSTMGNAYTFELQSLIFYSIAYACSCYLDLPPDVSVFGDDVLLDVKAYELFVRTLHEIGFVVNEKKSFASGNFRESCGGDYLFGNNIRPFYVNGKWSDSRLVAFLNFYYEDPLLTDLIREDLILMLRKENRRFGPKGFGDGHIHSDFIGTPHNRKHGFCGFTFDTFVKRAKRVKAVELAIGSQLYPVYGLPYSNEEKEVCEFTRHFSRYHAYSFALSVKDTADSKCDVKDSFSSEKDPYIIRGDGAGKTVRIYYIPD